MDIGLTISDTFGPLFTGSLIAALLLGSTILQAVTYYSRFQKDDVSLKAVVAILVLLDIAVFAFNSHAIYFYLVLNFENVLALLRIVWSAKVQVALTLVTVPLVQSLYAFRVYKLSQGQRILPLIVSAFVLASWGISLTTAVRVFRLETWTEIPTVKTSLLTNFALQTTTDFLISGSVAYYLRTAKNSFKWDSVLSSLLLYVFGTGITTGGAALVMLITFAAYPDRFIFLTFEIFSAKLYVNSFLGMLNARRGLRERTHHKQSSRLCSACQSEIHNPQLPYDGHHRRLSASEAMIKNVYGNVGIFRGFGKPTEQNYDTDVRILPPAEASAVTPRRLSRMYQNAVGSKAQDVEAIALPTRARGRSYLNSEPV